VGIYESHPDEFKDLADKLDNILDEMELLAMTKMALGLYKNEILNNVWYICHLARDRCSDENSECLEKLWKSILGIHASPACWAFPISGDPLTGCFCC